MQRNKSGIISTVTALVFSLGMLAWSGCATSADEDVRLSTPEGGIVRVAPGQTAQLHLRATGDAAFEASLTYYTVDAAVGYAIVNEPATPGCPKLDGLPGHFDTVRFDPTLAQGMLDCIYEVRRGTATINDLFGSIERRAGDSNAESVTLKFGEVADVSLSVAQPTDTMLLEDGRAQGFVQLTIRNDAPVDLVGIGLGDCVYGGRRVEVEGDFPGGCGINAHNLLCFGGSNSYVFEVSAPARGSSSCLVRLTSTSPYTGPFSIPVALLGGDIHNAATGGRVAVAQYQPPKRLYLSLDNVFVDGFE